MIAVIPVRGGTVPLGAGDAVRACGGNVLLAGEDAAAGIDELTGEAVRIVVAELGPFAPARYARSLAPLLLAEATVVLPGSPDGRDLAPRLCAALGRPLLSGATEVGETSVKLLRLGGRQLLEVACDGPFVATLVTGAARGNAATGAVAPAVTVTPVDEHASKGCVDAEVLEVLEADAGTVELADAARIVAGGGGVATPEAVDDLTAVAVELGASLGATRVLTDSGLVAHERQIGTTGAYVRPRLYLAFGISGAVQHVAAMSGVGHVVSVNRDPSCPMMAMADVALEADAAATLRALREALESHGT